MNNLIHKIIIHYYHHTLAITITKNLRSDMCNSSICTNICWKQLHEQESFFLKKS